MVKRRKKRKSKFFPILVLSVALASASWVFSSIIIRYMGLLPSSLGIADEGQSDLVILGILLVIILVLGYMLKKKIDYGDTIMDIADG